jgi:hypothetical protein
MLNDLVFVCFNEFFVVGFLSFLTLKVLHVQLLSDARSFAECTFFLLCVWGEG